MRIAMVIPPATPDVASDGQTGPRPPAASWTKTASPWTRIPQARTRNSFPLSGDPSTEFPLDVRMEQDDPAVRLDCPETQHLGHERPDLAGREVRHRDHVSAQQLRLAVPRLYGGRRPLDPKRTEVDL